MALTRLAMLRHHYSLSGVVRIDPGGHLHSWVGVSDRRLILQVRRGVQRQN
jgi:hypothetical protein